MAALRPAGYQLVPLSKLLLNGMSAILICDGVGVGKTISAAYILTYLTSRFGRSALVVCPPSLQDKWRMELQSKFSFRVVPVRSPEELDTVVDIWNGPVAEGRLTYVMPSSLLGRAKPAVFEGPVVIDEIHNYRNPDTNLWKAASKLTSGASHRIGLSATPINNRLEDLAAELALLLRQDRFVAEAVVDDLWRPGRRDALYPLVTRFSKERLGIHFASREIRDVRIRFPSEYRRRVVKAVKDRRERPVSESIFRDEITYFRLAASSPQAFERSIGVVTGHPEDKVRQLDLVVRSHQHEAVIVFCEFEETAQVLAASIEGRPSFLITGSVPVFEREETIAKFRESASGVLVMTSVGGEGLDLQFASALVNYDLTWNPMVLEQRVGRIDRIGQEKTRIRIYNFLVEGSIDERIICVLGKKLGLVTGSVLETSSLLGDIDGGRDYLFSEGNLEAELSRAETLVQSLELSKAIIPDDYRIIEAIDEGYCEVTEVVRAAAAGEGTPWLRDTEVASSWRQELTNAAGQLSDAVKLYS